MAALESLSLSDLVINLGRLWNGASSGWGSSDSGQGRFSGLNIDVPNEPCLAPVRIWQAASMHLIASHVGRPTLLVFACFARLFISEAVSRATLEETITQMIYAYTLVAKLTLGGAVGSHRTGAHMLLSVIKTTKTCQQI